MLLTGRRPPRVVEVVSQLHSTHLWQVTTFNFSTQDSGLLNEFKRLTEEIKPQIKDARKLTVEVEDPKDLQEIVSKELPGLEPQVIKMLPDEKPSECSGEQIARKMFGSTYNTLMRKVRESRAALRRGTKTHSGTLKKMKVYQ